MYLKLVKRDPCSYCGTPRSGTHDHIWPLHRADKFMVQHNDFGLNGWQNMTGACARCNCKKGCQLLVHFLVNNPIPA